MSAPRSLLTIMAVLSLAPAACAGLVYVPYQPDTDTALLYHLDEANGTTTATDSSATGLTLTASSSPFTGAISPVALDTAAGPIASSSTSLNKGGATAGEIGALDTETFTMEAWVRNPTLASGGDQMGIFQYRDGGSSRVSMRLENNFRLALSINRKDNGAWVPIPTSSPLTFDDDVWYHLAITYEGDGTGNDSTVNFYQTPEGTFEAQLIETLTGQPDIKDLTTGGAFHLGASDGAGFRSLGGDLDEFRYTNRTLEAEEMIEFIPEPASLSLLALGTAALLRRRRR